MEKDKIFTDSIFDTYSEPEETSIGWMILWAFIIIFGTCVLLETVHYLNWYIN
jgi:hypothetical protein